MLMISVPSILIITLAALNCENIYSMNLESHNKPGDYWLLGHNGPSNIYCAMNYTGLSCEDIYNNNPEIGDKMNTSL